jgi:beta-lysine 5,6-aminomutase beta subunit
MIVKPYGDMRDDGRVQISFTLPIPWSEAADDAARRLVEKMGFTDVAVADGRAIASEFSLFVVYARTPVGIDVVESTPAMRRETLTMDEVDELIARRVGRNLRIAGACIGTDAHTVGIDAILSMKGYKGDYGLERYHAFEVFNLGSQVALEELVRFAKERDVDAILVSQVVTEKGSDVANFGALAALLEAENVRDRMLLIAGGPRMTNLLAAKLGYDAGFGRGTLPSEVATFIARRYAERAAA